MTIRIGEIIDWRTTHQKILKNTIFYTDYLLCFGTLIIEIIET